MESTNLLGTENVYLEIPCYIVSRRHYYEQDIKAAQK
jgi:hypothetical protein